MLVGYRRRIFKKTYLGSRHASRAPVAAAAACHYLLVPLPLLVPVPVLLLLVLVAVVAVGMVLRSSCGGGRVWQERLGLYTVAVFTA